jgi:hypothetical protein
MTVPTALDPGVANAPPANALAAAAVIAPDAMYCFTFIQAS